MLNEDQKHQVKFFINQFTALAEEQWCVNELRNASGQRCAMGHTMDYPAGDKRTWNYHTTEATYQLADLFAGAPGNRSGLVPRMSGWNRVAAINNGLVPAYPQPTPKARILAALHDLLRS